MDHDAYVRYIILKEFGTKPLSIIRMKVGLCNEVYKVKIEKNKKVVVRLNKDESSLKGSDKFIPLFKSKEINVPIILAKDYSKKIVPYAYQVLTEIEGEDIGKVIDKLNKKQLGLIAKEISFIINKLKVISTNGKFGYVGYESKNLFSSWTKEMQRHINTMISRGEKTGVLDNQKIKFLHQIFEENRSYFDKVDSIFYYDDMSSKNVMIKDGKFTGLVDLDGVSFGDYLEAIGRIKASWYGTKNGDYYTKCVIEEQKLNKYQVKIVTMYALLHSIYWMCENGIQFNANTKNVVNKSQLKKDLERVEKLTIKYRGM